MAIKRNVRGGQPSPYPRILFHALRSAQLLGALVVSGIMAYFIYHLRNERYSVPWTFIVLLSISLATIVALAVTIVLYNFTYLAPQFNLKLNGSISLGWALGLGLLTWSISASNVLQRDCTARAFNGEPGAAVCRDYKALWSMTLCGTVSTFLALLLDIHTQRRVHRLGKYVQPLDDQAAAKANEFKTMRVRNQGYEAPNEQDQVQPRAVSWQNDEQDIAYHNRYGAEESHGPIDNSDYAQSRTGKNQGYNNPFRD